MAFQANASAGPSQTELCLRYPEPLASQTSLSFESAVSFLLKAIALASQHPFAWAPIDKPQDGQMFLVFLVSGNTQFPNDGVRYMEQEQRFMVPAGPREMEVMEIKYGFVPNSTDVVANRMRRRFRLIKGGHPQLMLVYYSRGPPTDINPPSLAKEPCRSYPIRLSSDPRIFVYGEKMGQKVFPPGQGNPAAVPGSGMNAGVMPSLRLSERLGQQNATLDALANRALPERPATSDEYDDEELDHLSTRSLAITRYKRNHELMDEVFWHASQEKINPIERKNPYEILDAKQMLDEIEKMSKDIEDMRARRPRRSKHEETPSMDVELGSSV